MVLFYDFEIWKMIYPSISYLNAIIVKIFIVIFFNQFKRLTMTLKDFQKLTMIVCFSHFCCHFLNHFKKLTMTFRRVLTVYHF